MWLHENDERDRFASDGDAMADRMPEEPTTVIARDLELLGVMRKLNAEMGAIVATLLDQMVDGELPAAKLCELAGIAHDLGTALEQRAEEISPAQEQVLVIDGEAANANPARPLW